MQHIGSLIQRVGSYAQRNSSVILTGFAVAGAAAATYLGVRAGYRSAQILHEAAAEKAADEGWVPDREEGEVLEDILTAKEKVDLTWKLYIPAVGVAALTVTAIIFARHIDQRRAAVVAAMYALGEKTLNEYREKVTETIGERKEGAIRSALGQDRVNRNPVSSNQVIVLPTGNHLAYDEYTGRYFTSNWEAIRSAAVEFNEQVQNDGFGSLTDFYKILGLPRVTMSDDIGWTPNHLLKMHIDATLTDQNDPCIYFEFTNLPEPRGFRD